MARIALLAALCCLTRGAGHDVSPVEKVIQLLEELKSEVEEEGKDEAKTYDTFACFCKDTTKEKSDAILSTQDAIEELAATMQEKSEASAEKAAEIAKLDTALGKIEQEISKIVSMREAEKTKYEGRAADLSKGVSSIEGAISDAKGGKVSLAHLSNSVKKSLFIADALSLNPKHSRKLSAFLQSMEVEDPEEGGDYNFHAQDLIETFEALDKQFVAKRAEVDQIEAQNKKDYNQLMKTKTNEKSSVMETKSLAEEEKSDLDKEVSIASGSMTEEHKKLAQDQSYLKDLTGQCELKAREWDQQSQMRADEVSALAKALDIIQAKVKGNAAVNARVLVQNPDDYVSDDQPVQARTEDIRDYSEEADIGDVGLSFLQKPPRQKLRGLASALHAMAEVAALPPAEAARQRAIAGLVQKGRKLSSPILSALAMKMAVDPFGKVKKLVQDLIQKLLAEAADEATKKGWCDTEMGKASHERNELMQKVMTINAELSALEANKAELEEEIATLTAEISELNESLAKTSKARADEKSENMDTLDKAKEGLAAVKDAYDVLQSFYKSAAKGKVALIQSKGSQPVQAPATTSGAYKGNQQKSGGILAMLDVIMSDFQRTIKLTTKAEKEAYREFVKFERETKASVAGKETSKSQDEFALKEAERGITENMDDLDMHQKMLDDVLKELEDLKPACVDTGMSYEDRVQKRKDEIEALKQAMCELDTEGKEESCK